MEFIKTLYAVRDYSDAHFIASDSFRFTRSSYLSYLISIAVKAKDYQNFNRAFEKEINQNVDQYTIEYFISYLTHVSLYDENNTAIFPDLAALFDQLIKNTTDIQKEEVYGLFLQSMKFATENVYAKDNHHPRLKRFFSNVLLDRAKKDSSTVEPAAELLTYLEPN